MYDPGGDLTQLTYPDGRVVTQSWDNADHLQTVTFYQWNGTGVNYNYLSSAGYWPDGVVQTATLGNGITETYSRNRRLQPVETLVKLGATKLFDKQFCYGPTNDPAAPFCTIAGGNDNGNITHILDTLNGNNSQAFSYDNLNRIASFVDGGGTMPQTYTIDPWGNMSISGSSYGATNLSFGPSNRITTSGYGYDFAGNLISYNNGVQNLAFTYDPQARILTADSGAVTYTYNPDGQRVRKDLSAGGWTEYVYFGGQSMAEKNSTGTWTDYIFAGGRRLAMASSTNATSPSTTTDYYHGDQIGSSRIITNGSGAVISTYIYTPFGQGPTPDENHYLFTGKERDAESGLDYFGARFYASSFMGRFMSPDDFGGVKGDPQSLNRYGYVENNPLSRVDPDGHMCMGPDGMMCSTHGGPGSLVDAMRADMNATYSWELEDTQVGPKAQQQSGTVPVIVGQRPIQNWLLRILSLGLAKHSYFIAEGDMVQVLGNPGSGHNQQVRINDPTRTQRGKEHTVYVSQAQADALVNGSEYFAQHTGSGLNQSDYAHPCPTCSGGQEGYNFLLHNSNSFVYNMLSRDPAGSIPPGSAPAFTPGWAMKPDDWYPNP